jgi:hypothetical protein
MPKTIPLIQFPTTPLMVACLAGKPNRPARGKAHVDASAISYLAMTVLTYEQRIRGIKWFRRLLGLAYLGSYLDCRSRPPRPLSEIVRRAAFAIWGRVTRPAQSRAPVGV